MIVIPRWVVSIILYFFVIALLLAGRPSLMFDADGNLKSFGVGLVDGQSPFSAAFVFPLIALLCYIFASLFKLAVA